jgi:hypothetical protein
LRFGLFFRHKIKNPSPVFLAMGLEYAETKKFLSQQPPVARRHGCATTTTHATTSRLVQGQMHLLILAALDLPVKLWIQKFD